jgi:nucleotide-binding universal stress UspA family protein
LSLKEATVYKHIMVPLDGSELAECVIPHVIAVAAGCNVPKVTLVRVVTPLKIYGTEMDGSISPQITAKIESESMALARAYLDKKAQELRKSGIEVAAEVMFGNVLEAMMDFAEKGGVDLIIIATHGRSGVSRWVWGSVADRILRSAKVPVLMIRPQGCPVPAV